MLIIGCDFHPGFQQVAIFDNQTGEYQEKRLSHREEAEQFYRSLAGQTVRVGMEACGHYPWFARQLLVDRHKQVQARTRTKNQLHALALSQGVQRKRKLWTAVGRAELEKLENSNFSN